MGLTCPVCHAALAPDAMLSHLARHGTRWGNARALFGSGIPPRSAAREARRQRRAIRARRAQAKGLPA